MDSIIPERLLKQKHKSLLDVPLKAVAYIRVSDESQVDGESLDNQRATIIRYAAIHNIDIVRWFGDEGISGKNVAKRTQLLELVTFCKKNKGKIGYALFYNMKRASRDVLSYYRDFKGILDGLGVQIRSATEHLEDSPAGHFIETVLIANGQMDNELKSLDVSNNMKSVAMQGWWQHGPIMGFDFVRVKIGERKKHTTLKKNIYAPIIQELFESFASGGVTQADLTRLARERGLINQRGKSPNQNAIYKMLTQPVYAGYICSKLTGFKMYVGKHIEEAIIDIDTFNAVQRRLKVKPTSRRGNKIIGSNELYPLKKLLLCFNCKLPYTASAPKSGGGGHSARYHCAREQCVGKVPSIKAETAHLIFNQMLLDMKPSEGVLRLYKEILNRTGVKQLENVNKHLKGLRSKLSKLDTERSTAMRRWNLGEMSDSDKDEIILTVASEKIEIREQIQELEDRQSVKQSQIEYAMNFMDNAQKMWHDAPLQLKIQFQTAIFPDGLWLDTKQLKFGTTKISPLYRYVPTKKDLSVKEKSLLVIPRRVELLLPG